MQTAGRTVTTLTITDAQLHHDRTRAQLASIWSRIQGLEQNYEVRRDLTTLHTNIRSIWAKMDNEMIECRRRGRATANYTTMADEIAVYLKLMEREVFWQKLH